ncbi:MAG: site-specific DNA-methyltransferase, partial [Bradymonadales bacterium]|nr:site-specific DNA-methyltransferase [Bradymonadales bacterium]
EHAIDFDVLRQELSDSIVEGREERYQFTWPDKKKAMLAANAPITATLRPVAADSVGKDGTPGGFDSENLYIEGDNLEVLKLLQETYLGKVKMIYIDPPYNTGNDFVYNDDFSQSAEEYMVGSGQYDEEGNRLVTNTESNGRFHTDWLNMIYPRLKLAKDLLAEDGVIFISIDDGEAANLLKVCNDIFGESNFVADLIWQKKFSRSNDATYFSTMHDHILCYCKSNIMQNENGWRIGLLPRDGEIPNGYANPDNDPRGVWTSVILSAKSGSDSLLYEIQTPSGRKVLPPSGRYWSCSKDTFEKWKADGRIWFGSNGDGTPRKKTFLSEVQQGLRPNTILFQDSVGNNQEAKQETKALFNGCGVFDGPKPVRLLNVLLKIANTKDDSIILDFFSGSATTAHAVMKLNAEDGGHRKFIMVQLPEKTDEKSEAYKAGYKNICEIGKERIRRAGKQILSLGSGVGGGCKCSC